jgi:hypothetical protein
LSTHPALPPLLEPGDPYTDIIPAGPTAKDYNKWAEWYSVGETFGGTYGQKEVESGMEFGMNQMAITGKRPGRVL